MAIVFHPFRHLLVGAFNPFKSKVILNKECTSRHSVTCFLVILWSFSVFLLVSLHVF